MSWYLYTLNPKTGDLLLLFEIINGDEGHANLGEPDDKPPMVFNSREEAMFVANTIVSRNNFSLDPISEDEMEHIHTPTGLRYRMKPK